MGEIVAAIATSHTPGITGWPERAPEAQRDHFYQGLSEARRVLQAARPDLIVEFSCEHFVNFFLDNMPAFCVGTGSEHRGPSEDFINIPDRKVPGHPDYARHLLESAYTYDFEPAFSERLLLDHGTLLPLHFFTPEMDVPVVPILQNCLVPPLPRLERCLRLGQVVRSAVEARPERVAIVATGGLSHTPGAPGEGRIDEAFDRDFLKIVEAGDGKTAAGVPDERVDAAGFGAWEIRQWVSLLGATDGRRGRVLVYEPIREWFTGCAVVSME